MPVYPVGQEREVTVLQTGQTPIHGVRPPQICEARER
jgi:hypothetical protein